MKEYENNSVVDKRKRAVSLYNSGSSGDAERIQNTTSSATESKFKRHLERVLQEIENRDEGGLEEV